MKAILKRWVFSLDLNSSIVGQVRRSASRKCAVSKSLFGFNARIGKACSVAGTAKVIAPRFGDSDHV